MTLEELEDTLPNGLHDSEVESVFIDYLRRTATIQMAVFVGEVDAPIDKREAYRNASLLIAGLSFASIEPPHANYPFAEPGTLRIDACDMRKDLDADLLAKLPRGSFIRSFFVNEWNAFIHLAGSDAQILWKGETVYRTKRDHFLPGETVES